MKKYVFKRIMMSLATLLVILLVLFVLMDKMPGSPFNDEKLTEAQRALLYAKYGLDQPIIVRFFLYVKNMLTGDLGVSYAINKNFPISSMIKDRLGISILVGLLAMIIGTIIGLILGILSALNHNTWIDNLCSAISVIGVSVPSYVCALLLCYFVNLMTGSSVIEKIFGIPGIGSLMISGIQQNDYNVTIACAFVYSAMYIVMMLIVDILYGVIDPRIRVSKEGK